MIATIGLSQYIGGPRDKAIIVIFIIIMGTSALRLHHAVVPFVVLIATVSLTTFHFLYISPTDILTELTGFIQRQKFGVEAQ